MGMTITAHDPHIDKSRVPSYIELKSPDKIYQYSDIISLHLPLLDSTRNIINDSVFEKMKSSAILINTAGVDWSMRKVYMLHLAIRKLLLPVKILN